MAKGYSDEYKKKNMEMAIRYNLIKRTKHTPLYVPIDLAIYMKGGCPFLKSKKRDGITSVGVYWTGRRIAGLR